MNKTILIGSIGVVFILVFTSFTSVVHAQTFTLQKTNSIKSLMISKINRETQGFIGGFITVAGGLFIVFLIIMYVGIATGNDAVLNLIRNIMEKGPDLILAVLYIIGSILDAFGLADDVFLAIIFLILFAYDTLDKLVGFLLNHSYLFRQFWDWWLEYRFPS